MIYPSLPPACYTDESWFERERENLFGKHWLFACLTQQLRSENSFVTRTLGGVPVLIQNLGGELKAFRNACPHRAAALQIEPYGNRKIICPYHGWSFDHDGKLRGIPLGTGYNFSEEDKRCMDLQPYALATIGSFVFVNLSETPKPVTEQFSNDLILLLEELSPWISLEVSYTTFSGNYNWKLNFENVAEGEGQHVPFVHQYSLAPAFKAEELSPPPPSYLFRSDGPLANICINKKQMWMSSIKPWKEEELIDVRDVSYIKRTALPYRPRWYSALMDSCDRGWYFACHIFPNVNLSVVAGEHIFVEQFMPLAPGRTEFHSWALSARLKKGVRPMPHMLWAYHHGEKHVVDEDIAVFESVQKVLAAHPENAGYLGENERSLAAFDRYVLQCLTEKETKS
ncbi:MAG: aromatic ring-hydroxylating dioxygenase subunit alpha [Zoogloeaceae bacterium]|jgi:phenylpropionate dioxygenase-like ring-hydroxylating dioxygenase large terminal subunit|nr:aromatic ring-hydroxylating dioxygenase subunit alpha [Zoogloeaceae bacterium]